MKRTSKQIEATTDKELIKVYTDSLRKLDYRKSILIQTDIIFTDKNIVVIYGGSQTEKTALAKEIASTFKNVAVIDAKSIHRDYKMYWQEVNKNTDVILIDGVINEHYKSLVNMCFSSTIMVNKQSQKPFEMPTPKVIITLTDPINEIICPSVRRRVMFLNF